MRYAVPEGKLFQACRKDRLEMGTLFFARDNCYLDVLEAIRFEKLVQLDLAEAKPMIGIKLSGPLEAVA